MFGYTNSTIVYIYKLYFACTDIVFNYFIILYCVFKYAHECNYESLLLYNYIICNIMQYCICCKNVLYAYEYGENTCVYVSQNSSMPSSVEKFRRHLQWQHLGVAGKNTVYTIEKR